LVFMGYQVLSTILIIILVIKAAGLAGVAYRASPQLKPAWAA
jgi:hypothetical protein